MRSFLPLVVLLSACSFPTLAPPAPHAANANGQCEAGEVAVVATPMSRTAKAQAKGVKETITCVQSGPAVLAFVKETQTCGTKLELRPATDALAQAALNEEVRECRAARLSVPKAGRFSAGVGKAHAGVGKREAGVDGAEQPAGERMARRAGGQGRMKAGAGKAGRQAPEVQQGVAAADGAEATSDSYVQ